MVTPYEALRNFFMTTNEVGIGGTLNATGALVAETLDKYTFVSGEERILCALKSRVWVAVIYDSMYDREDRYAGSSITSMLEAMKDPTADFDYFESLIPSNCVFLGIRRFVDTDSTSGRVQIQIAFHNNSARNYKNYFVSSDEGFDRVLADMRKSNELVV